MQLRAFAAGALAGLATMASASAHAADPAAGKFIATTVCAACHGANGISVSSSLPNLAGQRATYIAKQLDAYKSEKRKHPIMSALAAQMDKAAMDDVAAFYAGLPGAAPGADDSHPPANYLAKKVTLPADLSGFTHYMTFNHTGRKQLRKIYANSTAIAAAKAGRALPDGSVIVVEAFKAKTGADGKPAMGADGFYVVAGRAGFTAMERQAGWGAGFPDMIRNDNWQYGVFKPDRTPRAGANQASCLACHKPHAGNSYLFSLKELRAAAMK